MEGTGTLWEDTGALCVTKKYTRSPILLFFLALRGKVVCYQLVSDGGDSMQILLFHDLLVVLILLVRPISNPKLL